MEYSEKKIHIIEAAEKLFATNGFSGTSVRDIANEAGVNLAMISYYFGSKEKLMEALFEYRSNAMQLQSVIDDEKISSIGKVNHMIETYVEKVFNQECFHKIMVREQMRNNSDSTVAEMLKQFKKRSLQIMQQVVVEGQKKDGFRTDVDLQMLILTMTATTNQLISTMDYFKYINDLQAMPEDEFKLLMKNKLLNHLKLLFKAILTHEA